VDFLLPGAVPDRPAAAVAVTPYKRRFGISVFVDIFGGSAAKNIHKITSKRVR
jgi:hypothetical protein